jgi:glycosyltransferase involved in cell wall biosynthesis
LSAHIRQVDHVVAVARHVEETLRHFGIERICTIRNVADPERFHPQPKDVGLLERHGIGPSQPVIVHATNLRPGKRPLDVVGSAVAVLREHPNAIYLVIGSGPLRGDMESACREAHVWEHFRFAGEVEHGDMAEYLNLGDVVVVTSEREGFPFTYRETQACGRVLLASDIPPAREAISDGETGVLFRLGDVGDLAAKTDRLLRDPQLRHDIGHHARRAVEHETPEAWAARYAQVLQAVASG